MRIEDHQRGKACRGVKPSLDIARGSGGQPGMIAEMSFGMEHAMKCHELWRWIALLPYAKAIDCGGLDQDTRPGCVEFPVLSFLLHAALPRSLNVPARPIVDGSPGKFIPTM